MKRMLVGLLALSFPYAVQAAEDLRRVDIGDSRALDTILATNPAQYEKVIGILGKVAASVSCDTLPQMLKVQYGADQVQCAGHMILTSYPAKRYLAFKLDDVYFSGNVVLAVQDARLIPAR
jgi:hypothetical protein